MTKDRVAARTRPIIAEILNRPVDEVLPESHIVNDLGGDSLDLVELSMTLEEEFDIEIPDDDAYNLPTVDAVNDYLARRLA